MPIATPADYIVVPGKVDILVAFPSAYSNLFKLGESEDSIRIEKRPILYDVPGDRYGGSSGAPIEQQFLGLQCSFQLQMSRWDSTVVALLERFGGLLTTPGLVPLASIGALLHRDRGTRVLLYSTRDPSQSKNFPCCTWTQPQTRNLGTKYAACGFGITGNRSPEGFWHTLSEGVVYNSDTTGIT